MHRLVVVAAVGTGIAVNGCGAKGDSIVGAAPDSVARQWGDALKRGDLDAACRITISTKTPCSERLSELDDPSLKFAGPASIGVIPPPGEAVFSFDSKGGTIFVTVVRKQATQRVRLEAVVLEAG